MAPYFSIHLSDSILHKILKKTDSDSFVRQNHVVNLPRAKRIAAFTVSRFYARLIILCRIFTMALVHM